MSPEYEAACEVRASLDSLTEVIEARMPSLRDYFAALALAGELSNPAWNSVTVEYAGAAESAAVLAYEYADAMLIARKPKETKQ